MRRDSADDQVELGEALAEDLEWLFLDGHSAGFFRIGDELRAGSVVGPSSCGTPLRASRDSTVVGVEYDWDSDQLILVAAPSTRDRSRSQRPLQGSGR